MKNNKAVVETYKEHYDLIYADHKCSGERDMKQTKKLNKTDCPMRGRM